MLSVSPTSKPSIRGSAVSAENPVIAVVIPVGPQRHHARWLDACLISIARQSRLPNFILIVDDMADVELPDLSRQVGGDKLPEIIKYSPPWRLGVAHAFNHGVAKAFEHGADLALMLGADDLLETRVVEALAQTYLKRDGRDGYYWSEVLYSGGEIDGHHQTVPCNCAAVTPGVWRETGGFPVESAHGACDAAFISILMIHKPSWLVHVPGMPSSRFIHRLHEQQATRDGAPGIDAVRGWLTDRYVPTEWGRYGV